MNIQETQREIDRIAAELDRSYKRSDRIFTCGIIFNAVILVMTLILAAVWIAAMLAR